MAHPLDGPRAKIKRGKREINALDRSFQSTFKRYPYRVVQSAQLNRKTGQYDLRVRGGPPAFPDHWGVSIGEIAHDLRSSLDGVAWQLALSNGWTEQALIAQRPQFGFPVFVVTRKRSRQWVEREVRNRLVPLKDCHRAAIEGFQPYHRGNLGRRSPLWLLHELNNTDKHRLITVVTASAGMLGVMGASGGSRLKIGVSLRDNAKVGQVAPLPGGVPTIDLQTGRIVMQHNVQVQTQIAPGVRFGNSCDAVKRLPVVRTLQRMADEASSVVESFAEDFA